MAFWDSWPLIGKDKSGIKTEVKIDRFERQELLSAHDYTFTQDMAKALDSVSLPKEPKTEGGDPSFFGRLLGGTIKVNEDKSVTSSDPIFGKTTVPSNVSIVENIKRTLAKYLVIGVLIMVLYFVLQILLARSIAKATA